MSRRLRSGRSSSASASIEDRPKRRAAKTHFFKYQLATNPSRAEENDLKRALQESLEDQISISGNSTSHSLNNSGKLNSTNSSGSSNSRINSSSCSWVSSSSSNSSKLIVNRGNNHVNSCSSSNESAELLNSTPKRTRSSTSITPSIPSPHVNNKRAKLTVTTNGHQRDHQRQNNNINKNKCDITTSVLPQVTKAIKTYSRSQPSISPQNNITISNNTSCPKQTQHQGNSAFVATKTSTPIAYFVVPSLAKFSYSNGTSSPNSSASPVQTSVSKSTQTPSVKPKIGLNSIIRDTSKKSDPHNRLAITIQEVRSSMKDHGTQTSKTTKLLPKAANVGKGQGNHPKLKRDGEKEDAEESSTILDANNSSGISVTKRRSPQGSWSLLGIPEEKVIYVRDDEPPRRLICYPAIKHVEGDVIQVRDSVLLRSGAKKTDPPYIAKVYAFWEDAETGNVMMSLFWYYRPEHTEDGRKPHHLSDEIFASRHRDCDSVECIEDKCYVLTFNEYCRHKKRCKMEQVCTSWSLTDVTIPVSNESYPRRNRIPDSDVNPELVFCCRQIYDSRTKRLLKNPLINSKYGHI